MKNKRLNSCNDERTYSTSSSIQKKTKAFSARTKYFLRTLLKKVYIVKRFRDKENQKTTFLELKVSCHFTDNKLAEECR